MRVKETIGSATAVNQKSQQAFKIRTSRKSFEILSSGLYSNKIQAVVRELATNAFDSHVAAGKVDVPFLVHLPNKVESWFAVEDFGIGLSPSKAVTTYTTYFDSDKTDSNDYTGALGLGSKSPFCYTDSFSVVTTYEGCRTTFQAYLSAEGVPTLSLASSEEATGEPNGVRIVVPVQCKDHYLFGVAANEVFPWFQTIPTIGGQHINWDNRDKPILVGDNYDLYACNSDVGHSVVMGNVRYPIDTYALRGTSAARFEKLDFHALLYVDIGDVEVAASREQLSYTQDTIKFLGCRLDTIIENYRVQIQADADACVDLWGYKRLYARHRSIINALEIKLTYRGAVENYSTITVKREIKRASLTRKQGSIRFGLTDAIHASADEDLLLFLPDSRGWQSALKEFCVLNRNKATTVYVLPAELGLEYLEWLSDTGLSKIVRRTSDLPVKVRGITPRASRGPLSKVSRVLLFDPTGNFKNKRLHHASRFWASVDVNLKTAPRGVYTVLHCYEEKGVNYSVTQSRIEHASTILGTPLDVYGIKAGDVAKFDKAGWRSLDSVIAKIRSKITPRQAESVLFADWLVSDGTGHDIKYALENVFDGPTGWKSLPDGNPLKELLIAAQRGTEISKEYKYLVQITKDAKDKTATRLGKLIEKFKERYPFLALVFSERHVLDDIPKAKIAAYIRSC
jgi:hypothetical protein